MEGETGFILQCNRSCFIEKVMYSEAALEISSVLNQPLLFCLAPESLETGKHFLEAIRWAGKAENYDLGILLKGEIFRFTFSGVQLGGHIIIVAQHKPALPEETTETITDTLIANEIEQSLQAENVISETPETEDRTEVTVWDLLDEMSRLNNELINTKRELTRKNIELEKLKSQLKKG